MTGILSYGNNSESTGRHDVRTATVGEAQRTREIAPSLVTGRTQWGGTVAVLGGVRCGGLDAERVRLTSEHRQRIVQVKELHELPDEGAAQATVFAGEELLQLLVHERLLPQCVFPVVECEEHRGAQLCLQRANSFFFFTSKTAGNTCTIDIAPQNGRSMQRGKLRSWTMDTR